jgi:hypothetical protein
VSLSPAASAKNHQGIRTTIPSSDLESVAFLVEMERKMELGRLFGDGHTRIAEQIRKSEDWRAVWDEFRNWLVTAA